MNETRAWSTLVLAVSAVIPLGAACGGSNKTPANTPPAVPASVGAGQPPPGYANAAPPGYPGTYPAQTAGYPPAQPAYSPGYNPPAGYPQQPPPANGQPAPTTVYPTPTTGGYPPVQGAPAPGATTAASGPLAPTDPNSSLQAILTGLQGALQGTLVAPGSLPTDVTEAGLRAQALRVAPGMQPEGDELKQTLSEGQHAVMMVTLQAGKCYTIVGFSPPGAVKDLDLNLLAPPLYITLAGQDLTHNGAPSVGGSPSPMCPVIAFPLQYKLDVFARSGSGQAAVQLYSKTKS